VTDQVQELARLRLLARLHGIQTSYVDHSRRTVKASRASLMAALLAIEAPMQGSGDVAGALRSRVQELWRRPLEPVLVAWDGRCRPIRLRLPLWVMDARRGWSLTLENGETLDVSEAFRKGARGVVRAEQVESATFVEMEFAPAVRVPAGYHRLDVEFGGSVAGSLLVSAPRKTGKAKLEPSWGVFLPLYALRTRRSWGLGDLTDLGDLVEWVAGLGGEVVATLPILSAFFSGPFEPSPYSPASRLFWNELHLDVPAIPELERSAEARELLRSRRLHREIAELQAGRLVDHRAAMAAKRRVLELLAESFYAHPSHRPAGFDAFARDRTVQDYASFRANCERREAPWRVWPRREREGHLPKDGGDRAAFRYHTYVQWLMRRQMEDLGQRAAQAGARLYFDFPLGVNPDGYDVWRERDAFALGAAAGSPPDPFFTAGQDWGFPPLHPERIRQHGYRYVIACLRHVLRHAGVLRIDHVMSLHRLYWVPRGLDARHGVYVRYRPEELYAILALESARGDAAIVGEDLGTVPDTVRRAMRRHGIYRSYVLQMEIKADPRRAINPAPRDSLASMNTHDLPPFAAFWKDSDLAYRTEGEWLDQAGARRERAERRRLREAMVRYLRSQGWLRGSGGGNDGPGAWDVLRASLSHLAAGEARIVLVNLEDLWLEERPQNVPGTSGEDPNWRRPARYPFERFRQMRRVTGTLRHIDALRKRRDPWPRERM
jgi:4-alpha-glucanotransferase